MADFHVGWDAFWTREGVPSKATWQRPAKEFEGKIELDPRLLAGFLHTRNLKPGDVFIPVVEGGDEKFTGVLAGIYRFNSDLRGNFIFCLGCGPAWENQFIGETRQAEYIPRGILLSRLHGIDKVFIYNFRNDEWYMKGDHREAHFGLVRQNLDPKPAFHSYRTLTRMCPAGATPPERTVNSAAYLVSWRRPDGKKVWALWSRFRPRTFEFKTEGKIESAVDFLGNELPIPEKTITVSPQIQYLVGPGKVTLIQQKN
jgi:hypothetical protein